MRGRSRAALAAVLLTLSLVGAACGGGDDDEVKTASSSTTSSSVAATSSTTPGEETTTTEAAGPDTTRRPAASATTAAPVATAPPATAPPGPVAIRPAAPGRYSYATSGGVTFTGGSATFPAVTTNLIDPPAGTRQHATRNLQDAAGNGTKIEYTFDYRPAGIFLESIRFTTAFSTTPVGPVNDVRELTPPTPLLFVATGAGPGSSQTLSIPVGTGGTATVVVDVLRTEQVTVGGQAIDTLVVRSAATLPPGDVSGTQTLTVNLDPASGLWLKEQGVGDASAAGGLFTLHSQYAATLQSLTPG